MENTIGARIAKYRKAKGMKQDQLAEIMGVSPQQYLIDLRLRNARDLLISTDLSISEVARSVGYDDPLYFSRLYRKHYGLSPRESRHALK